MDRRDSRKPHAGPTGISGVWTAARSLFQCGEEVKFTPQPRANGTKSLGLMCVSRNPLRRMHVVAAGGRGLPTWGKFFMNPVKPKEGQGKDEVGERVCIAHSLLGSTVQPQLHPPLAAAQPLASPACPFRQELHGQVSGDWQHQINHLSGTEGRRE